MTKQRYFTAESIEKKSREMLEEVRELGAKYELSPKHSALLILDMQRYFLEESSHACIPAAQAIISKIVELVESYYQRNLPIIFTRHLNSATDAKMMAKWWRDLIKKDDPLSNIIPEFDLSRGMIIEKSQYDAFYETRLEEILRQKGVTQVVVCGVMAHLCCETTARSAFVRGFEVFFTVNGTATYNERFHRATLLNLAHGFAVPVLVDEILVDLSNPDEN
jgi:isochorismate hydrolase